MKILIASGAFKQSLSAVEACAAIHWGLQQSGLDSAPGNAAYRRWGQRHAGCFSEQGR